jgi:hypothetical protein
MYVVTGLVSGCWNEPRTELEISDCVRAESFSEAVRKFVEKYHGRHGGGVHWVKVVLADDVIE